MGEAVVIMAIAALAFLVNLPLGRLRARSRKYSVAWFAAIHASIPVIVILRVWQDVPWGWAPLFVLCAVSGQWLGGRGATSPACRSGRGRASARSGKQT